VVVEMTLTSSKNIFESLEVVETILDNDELKKNLACSIFKTNFSHKDLLDVDIDDIF
jgi:hypothetical protein